MIDADLLGNAVQLRGIRPSKSNFRCRNLSKRLPNQSSSHDIQLWIGLCRNELFSFICSLFYSYTDLPSRGDILRTCYIPSRTNYRYTSSSIHPRSNSIRKSYTRAENPNEKKSRRATGQWWRHTTNLQNQSDEHLMTLINVQYIRSQGSSADVLSKLSRGCCLNHSHRHRLSYSLYIERADSLQWKSSNYIFANRESYRAYISIYIPQDRMVIRRTSS